MARTFIGSLADELQFTRRTVQFGLESAGGGGDGAGDGGAGGGEGTELFVHEDTQVDSLGFGGACRWVLRDIGAADKDTSRPSFRQGDRVDMAHASVQRRQTQPPRFLQEHELIERMDAHRIGTDASMAVHVSNIVDRGFVVVCDETGVPLRPPRPPRAGTKPHPRQVGRYMVPTPLGIQLLALFGGDGGLNAALNAADASGGELVSSPALLSQPAIRARMEAEVRQIARGEISKDEVVGLNVKWFHERYRELEASLTRQRVDNFARALEPIGPALKRWRRAGAFKDAPEPTRVASSGGQQRSRRGPQSRAAGTSGQRRSYSTRAVRGRGRGGGRGRGRGARS